MKFFLPLLAAVLFASPAWAQAPAAPAAPAAAPALDFGNYSSSSLTDKAWDALGAKNYAAVQGYTQKCIDMYKAKAVEQQATLKAPVPKDSAFNYWALNDVGTSYYILGQALDAQGNTKGAIDAYKFLADNLSFSQCWDPKGWFWKPADAARKRLTELQFQAAQ